MKQQLHTIRRLLTRSLGVGLLLGALCLNEANAQVSVTASAGTPGPTPYTTVNEAFSAIVLGTHQGAITITISGNTTEPTFAAANQLIASGTSSANYTGITIVPQGNVVVNSAAAPSASRGMLEFIGADNITIDGDDPLTAGTRNLTFAMASVGTTYCSALRFSSTATSAASGCRNIIVKNCNIIGSRNSSTATDVRGLGIYAAGNTSGTLASISTGAADNDNWLIENNYFKRLAYGLFAHGDAINVMDSLVVRNNKFGNDTSAQNVGLAAIYIVNTATSVNTGSAIIQGNEIQSGDYTSGLGTGNYGIYVREGNAGLQIFLNNIHDVANPSSGGWQAHGISLASATSSDGVKIYNNMIRDMYAYHYSSGPSTYEGHGIYIGDNFTNVSIVHNTIALTKPNLGSISANNSSSCVFISAGAPSFAAFKNNILVNKQSDGAGQKCMAIYLANASTFSSTSGVVDRNNYYAPGVSGMVGYIGTNYTSLASWKAVTTKDSNSFNVDPTFVSPTNLRLQNVKSALESNGDVTFVTTDYDGNVRPGPVGSVNGGGLAPDIGAHEADMLLDYMTPDSARVTQIVQIVAPGDTTKAILNVKVYVSGSIGTPFNVNSLLFNTIGSTNAANIDLAKVYYTGASGTFSPAVLYGTTPSPNGSFVVSGTQSVAPGVHNFWLAYDINGASTSSNVVDARLDSVSIGSVYLVPTVGNPSGNVTILSPITYIGSEVTQANVNKVYQGETNREVMGLRLIMSHTGSSVSVNSIDLNLNGTTDTADITNIKVWYTGNNKNFATTSQFGATSVYAPATSAPFNLTVTGTQPLSIDTNYFWVTYDIRSSAVALHLIDGEITQINIGANAQFPTVTAPAGNREIRPSYCTTSYGSGCGTDFIANVVLGSLSNPTGCTGPLTFYNAVTIPNLTRGLSYPMSVTYGSDGSQFGRVWIDFNDDGDFTDPGEDMGIPTPANPGSGGTTVYNLAIPCNAGLGNLRMRIRGGDDSQPSSGQSCGVSNSGWGEAEDYIINILDNPLVYNFSTTQQQTGVVAPGTIDQKVLRVPFRANGCGLGTITEMRFTNTSTSAGDIMNAKLYRTAGNTFNNSNQRGTTIGSPTGQFMFMLTDTVNLNDTTNYWLAFDVAPGATLSNTVDATYDSAMFMGNYYVPTVKNPAGNIQINAPMTFIGATTIQPITGKVGQNATNSQIIGMQVQMSATGSPLFVTDFNLNLNGTTDTANISNIKVWYTGNSGTFAATTQFGSTVTNAPATAAPFPLTVTGLQALNTGTNYFWVTFDIKATATIGQFVDAECTGLTVGGVPQIPTVTAPVGDRQIRAEYCIITGGPTCPSYSTITNVNFGSINNTTAGCDGLTTTFAYTNWPATAGKTTTVLRGVNMPFSITVDANPTIISLWIDWNNDGLFDPIAEYYQPTSFVSAASSSTTTIGVFVPCNAVLGETRMRIRTRGAGNPNGSTSACDMSFGSGESEDYTITILDNPLAFSYVGAQQQTGVSAPGTTDKSILRIPVRANGCGYAVLNEVRMSTTGTTVVGDIMNAKLYRTTGATFNTSDLRGTVPSPSGQFMFSLTDTLPVTNDTVNYWLAYDVSPSAAFGNSLDAKLDSIQILGNYQVPTNGNPAGNVLIMAPMTVVSTTTTQNNTGKVEVNSTNSQIIGIQVVTSAIGSPISVTNFDLNLNGTTDTADISNIKVWYTGNSNTFATTAQFGATMTNAPATSSPYVMSIAGSQSLNNNTNYFWVTYDIKGTATVSNTVDGECTSITISGTPQTPTITAPAGVREIRGVYCTSVATVPAGDGEITGVILGTLNNSSTCGVAAPGPNSIAGGYSNYTTSVAAPAVPAGGYIPFDVATSTCGGSYNSVFGIWIDYNDDGDFTDANETVYMSDYFYYGIGIQTTGTIIVPLDVTPGPKRIRFVLEEGGVPPISPCTSYGYGETEDYVINILAAPAPTTYTWNQSVAASYVTATNWTPSRTNKNLNDKLLFTSGTAVSVGNVESEKVSSLTIANNTSVTLNGTAGNELATADSLNLTSGKLTTGNGFSVVVGSSHKNVGVITGTGSVEGSLTRWIDTLVASYTFPMIKGAGSRSATIAYTTAPTAGGRLNVRYIPGAPSKLGLPLVDGGYPVDSISADGIWGATTSNGLAGGTFDVTIQANNIFGVTNYTSIRLIARADNVSPWLAPGTGVTTTGTNAAMTLSRTGLTAYGQIGIGGDNTNPLPVTLVSFTATAQGKDAALNWITASETNNSGFDVERSLDGRNFEKVSFVKGAGNSSRSLDYTLTDRNALTSAKVVYYRLKQIDFNGKFEYSNIVKVTANSANVNGISVSPNPYSTDFNVTFNAISAGNASIELVDIQGRSVGTQSFDVVAGINNTNFNNASALQAGVYFVRLTVNGETQTLKLVKN